MKTVRAKALIHYAVFVDGVAVGIVTSNGYDVEHAEAGAAIIAGRRERVSRAQLRCVAWECCTPEQRAAATLAELQRWHEEATRLAGRDAVALALQSR